MIFQRVSILSEKVWTPLEKLRVKAATFLTGLPLWFLQPWRLSLFWFCRQLFNLGSRLHIKEKTQTGIFNFCWEQIFICSCPIMTVFSSYAINKIKLVRLYFVPFYSNNWARNLIKTELTMFIPDKRLWIYMVLWFYLHTCKRDETKAFIHSRTVRTDSTLWTILAFKMREWFQNIFESLYLHITSDLIELCIYK